MSQTRQAGVNTYTRPPPVPQLWAEPFNQHPQSLVLIFTVIQSTTRPEPHSNPNHILNFPYRIAHNLGKIDLSIRRQRSEDSGNPELAIELHIIVGDSLGEFVFREGVCESLLGECEFAI